MTIISTDGNSDETVQTQEEDTSDSDNLDEENVPDPEENENALLEGVTPETENAQVVNSIRLQRLTIDSDTGGVQNWRDTDMAEDAVELGEEDDNPMLPVAIGTALLALILGGLWRFRWFRQQLQPIKETTP
jgi:hypothetical protein